MDKETLDGWCRKLPGCTYDYQPAWECDRYHVGGKLFAMIGGDGRGKDILTLKCDPAWAGELRDIYPGIIAGYHMNKTHWNSVYFDADIPRELWQRMIAHAHEQVVQKLPKKVRQELS